MKLLLALFVLAGTVAAEDTTIVEGDLGRSLDLAVQQQTQGGFWGVVLVAREGKVVLAKGYGNQDYEKTPNTPRSLFEIASASKMFTAIAILRLESQGKLATADPISKWFKGVPADKKAITIQHLLNHTSGITGEGLLPYQAKETADELVALVMGRPLDSKVGEKFGYSNVGYSLLAVIIEKASGQPFETYMRDNIFKPADMKDTGFLQDPALDASRATVRLDRDSKSPVGSAIQWGWSWGYRGMGGIVTTGWDLFRFDRAMRGDAILNDAAKNKEMTPALDGYGCGCLVQSTPTGKTKISHTGSVSGYLCAIDRFIEDDALVIVLSNTGADLFGVEKSLSDALFPPPVVTVAIDVKGRKLNEGGGFQLKKGASWKGAKSGGNAVLSLETKEGTLAKVTFPAEAAAGLLKQVQESIEARKKAGEKDDGSLETGVYTGGLALNDGRVEVKGVECELLPEYRGTGADGKEVVDKRMLLLLKDPASGQWPFMAHMSLGAAAQLVQSLKAALEK